MVVFHALDSQHIASIARIQLKHLENVWQRDELQLEVSDAALALISEAVSTRCMVRVRSSGPSRAKSKTAGQVDSGGSLCAQVSHSYRRPAQQAGVCLIQQHAVQALPVWQGFCSGKACRGMAT